MKWIKNTLRLWIAGASVFSFLAGWILFANSGKPAPLLPVDPAANNQAVVQQPQDTTTSINGVVPLIRRSQQQAPAQSQPSFSGGFRLRTRGS